MGCSPWGVTESDTTELLTVFLSLVQTPFSKQGLGAVFMQDFLNKTGTGPGGIKSKNPL